MASIRSKISSLREYLTPINHTSNFSTTGEISPEEFVKAGDYLVYKFPTWQWSKCPKKELEKSFLPPDKQFLITKHVPSYQRAGSYLTGEENPEDGEEEEEEVDEDGWVKSKKIKHDNRHAGEEEEAAEIEEITEIDNEEGDAEEEGDFDEEFDIIEDSTNNKLRKYDLYITYSTSYRVPKLYLVGFDSNGIPLLPNQMFEDINLDYKDKTATIEKLPVGFNTTSVSIHPCKHSSVMKVLMKHSKLNKNKEKEEEATAAGGDLSEDVKKLSVEDKTGDAEEEEDGIRVDHYLIIFLKFIASVTPGIEYDYTMDAL
ncbi:Autophagy-related protein 3 [Candida viswanathii]|uniref:Autophagy-related protein 3 n=1 Tax=Candida viswanathii TaxID=5486 RepID=A0A367XR06_9ASCO|nr:Autophagy-related protein 3 [Candida viswanathii]